MNITLIQTHLHWEDVEMNIDHFSKLISGIDTPTDLIVLPEMFTTGFTMKPEKNAEEHLGPGFEFMKRAAQQKNAVITGSISTKHHQNYFNRLYWVEPNGKFDSYDKRHLFRMAKEDGSYSAGNTKIIKQINDWNFCPLICYDLRFPVWSRNRFTTKNNHEQKWDYDVLIYVANWPQVRNYPWKQLLIARAIENQCYVVGVNRIGKDGNNIDHSGDSMVIDPKGQILSITRPNEESVETVKLDMDMLEDFRKSFPAGLDADEFELK